MNAAKLVVAGGALAIGLLVAQTPARAEAGGCLKYGAAGAVGGHLAGHGVLGALAGCGAGMWTRHEARKHAADERNATDELNRTNRAPEYQNGRNGGSGDYSSRQGNGNYQSSNQGNGNYQAPTPFYRQ